VNSHAIYFSQPYIWESLLKLNAETANSSQTTFKVIATNKAGTVEVIVLVTKNINHPLPLNRKWKFSTSGDLSIGRGQLKPD